MGELKYLIFFFVLLIGVPVGYLLALRKPLVEKIVFFMMIFFTCRLGESINFVSHETYRGTSRGFEVTLVDIATLIIFFLVWTRRSPVKIRLIPPGTFLYLLYFVFSVASISNSGEPLYSWFEVWKMIRMYFFFWTLYNYLDTQEKVEQLFRYFAWMVVYIFLVVIDQKYHLRIYQTNGPFPHQNSLVMYMIIINSLMLAKLLQFDKSFREISWTLIIFGLGSICVISTLSRGGLLCYGVSIAMIMTISFISKVELKNVVLLTVMAMLGVAVLGASLNSIITRIKSAPESSKNSRIELAHGAVRMAQDKTLGIGLNNFGLKINDPYPYGDHIPRATADFKEGLVETTYLMIAAETGWHNLVIFLLFILYFYARNIYNYWRGAKNPLRFIALGLIGGLLAIYLESTLEWVLKQTNNFYQLMLVFAIIANFNRIKITERTPDGQVQRQ